jgi:hypothetical protein
MRKKTIAYLIIPFALIVVGFGLCFPIAEDIKKRCVFENHQCA